MIEPKATKYQARKIHFAGIWFHSQLEAAVYGLILLRVRAKEIDSIKCQVRVKFHTHEYGYVTMIPDFRVRDTKTHKEFFIEAKGFKTREWVRKRKAWLLNGPAEMEIWEGSYKRPGLTEILVPKGLLDA